MNADHCTKGAHYGYLSQAPRGSYMAPHTTRARWPSEASYARLTGPTDEQFHLHMELERLRDWSDELKDHADAWRGFAP